MLTSYEWLKDHIDDPDIIIIDSRPKISYNYGHLKNSISLSVEQLIRVDNYGSHLVGDAQTISETLGKFGIDGTKTLIVAGESMDTSVARIMWTIQYLGHEKIMFLQQSFAQLQEIGAEFTKKPFIFAPSKFNPKINTKIRIEADDFKNDILKFTLLDARFPQEFMHGHIPNSILIPFTEGVGKNGDLFLLETELKTLFKKNNISHDKEIICYCTHGYRASNLFYQLKLAQFSNVRLYDGSLVEWSGMGLGLE